MTPIIQSLFLRVIQFPKTFILLTVAVVFGLAWGLPNLTISNDFRVYLSKDNPQLKAFEAFEDDYIKSDIATLVITAKQDDLFTRQGLMLLEELTEQAWQLDYAYRVSSLTNYTYTQSDGDDIESNYLVDNLAQINHEKIQSIREIALSEKRLTKSLITEDGKVSVILITLNLPEDKPNTAIKITQKVEQLRDEYQKKYPDFLIENGGSTAFNATLARAVENDLSTLLPLSYLIIFSGLFLFLRSFFSSCAIFILITLCLIATFGLFGWLSPTLTPIAGFAPSILLSIMVADSVHILTSYQHLLAEGKEKRQAILESLNINFMPVLITSITTIIGFLSLNFSASPPYRDLGNMVAFGVLIAFVFSLVLLPSLMTVLPIKNKRHSRQFGFFDRFYQWVFNARKKLIIFMSVFTIGLIGFIPNNKLSDNWATYFDNSFELIRLVQRLDGYLTGINALEYSLKPKQDYRIFSPDYMQQVDKFQHWFEQQNKVVNVNSFTELMKDLNQVMNSDDPNYYSIPKSSELAAQYLLFYELGLPTGLDLTHLVNIHQTATRFTVSVTSSGSDELLAIDQKAQNWLKQNAPAIQLVPATGLGVVFAHIAQRNMSGLLFGTFIALIAISFVLALVLKSIKYGLISLIPNLIPAALAYGLWGIIFGYVDISLSIVACCTLGIVVDDTVHFLHKYIRAKKQGKNTNQALKETFNRVGIALVTTSVVLASGFLILTASPMNTSAAIGLLMAITLIFALIVDFLLLPPLLLYLDKKKSAG